LDLLVQIVYWKYPFVDTILLFFGRVDGDAVEGVGCSTEDIGQSTLTCFPWLLLPGFNVTLELGRGTLWEYGQGPLVFDHSVGKALKHDHFPHLGEGPVFNQVDFGPGPVDVARWQWDRQR